MLVSDQIYFKFLKIHTNSKYLLSSEIKDFLRKPLKEDPI